MWILIIIVLVLVGVVFLAISHSNSKLINTKLVNNRSSLIDESPLHRSSLPNNAITRTNTVTTSSTATYNFNIVGEGLHQSNLKK